MKRVKSEKKTAKVLERERKKKIKAIIDVFVFLFKENDGIVTSSDIKEAGYTYDQVRYYFGNLKGLEEQARAAKPTIFLNIEKKKAKEGEKATSKAQERAYRQNTEEEIIRVYANIAELKGYATLQDMAGAGFKRGIIEYWFGSLTNLNRRAREAYPQKFFDVVLDGYIESPHYHQEQISVIEQYSRFILTTAITGCRVDHTFLQSMETYCEENDTKILVLVSSDPAHNYFNPGAKYGTIDKALIESPYCTLVVTDCSLNENLNISTVKLGAKQIDPAASMERIAADYGTFVFGSPKQRLKPVATSQTDYPHFVMTPGAITISDYTSANYMSNRTALIADYDHVMGGIIIEVVNDRWYHFRQFQSAPDGSFCDLGYRYHDDGAVTRDAPKTFVLGDWHSGSTDQTAVKAWKEVIEYTGAESLIIHDGYDGRSISHHEREDVIKRAKRAQDGTSNLRSEIQNYVKDLNMLSDLVDNVYLVKSNHDEVLLRYLQKGYYVKDPQNHRYALPLAIAAIDGIDPLRHACELENGGKLEKVTWWSRNEDHKIANVVVSAHGDKGPASRGSIQNLEKSLTIGIIGHSHQPQILRGMFQCGTSSSLQLDYNEGSPSGWCHTSCLVYSDGTRQLINSFNGSWRKDD